MAQRFAARHPPAAAACFCATSPTWRSQLSARPTRVPVRRHARRRSRSGRPRGCARPSARPRRTGSLIRQLRSVCTTTLAMLRWTKTSPGARPMIWLAGTRESEQPIHRYFGACCVRQALEEVRVLLADSRRPRPCCVRAGLAVGSCAYPRSMADVLGFGEEAHGLDAAFAAQAGLLHAAERRAQVAHQPGVDPDDAGVDALRRCGARGAGRWSRRWRRGRSCVALARASASSFVVEGLQGHHRPEDFLGIGARSPAPGPR